jgi:hypothetical protein
MQLVPNRQSGRYGLANLSKLIEETQAPSSACEQILKSAIHFRCTPSETIAICYRSILGQPWRFPRVGLNEGHHAADIAHENASKHREILAHSPFGLIGRDAPVVPPPGSRQFNFRGDLDLAPIRVPHNAARDESAVSNLRAICQASPRDKCASDQQPKE